MDDAVLLLLLWLLIVYAGMNALPPPLSECSNVVVDASALVLVAGEWADIDIGIGVGIVPLPLPLTLAWYCVLFMAQVFQCHSTHKVQLELYETCSESICRVGSEGNGK